MLINLHVKNLAIIDEVEVYFTEHLNILTGETGAGKSIIIGSINIALGGKVSKDMIRKGADYALVELVFQIDDVHTLAKIKQLDLPVEDNQIIISRKIMNGRSISKINGENVTASILKEIASLVIDIHGQHEHQSLLYKTKHLEIVDRYAKDEIMAYKLELSKYYSRYIELKNEWESSFVSEDQRLRELSFLEYEINEIESARLKDGEEEQLYTRFKKLANANTIVDSVSNVYDITSESNQSISDNMSRSIRLLAKVEDLDEDLSNFRIQLEEIEGLLNDFNREVADYMENLNYDGEEYDEVEHRLDLIHSLKAKYGGSYSEIMNYYERSKEKLLKYQDFERYLENLSKERSEIEEKLEDICTKISTIRKQKAAVLTTKITEALADLNFQNFRFEIHFEKLDRYTTSGYDEVEFMITTNLGEDIKPLATVASGGELSRIMLAIKSVLADNDAIDTLIFDEIDVGVSGRTAQKVSERLSVIAKNHQVLCITHLPQIAAMADTHFIIEKSSDDYSTRTNIRQLNENESIDELARILSGARVTDSVITSAKEMKELATNTKLY